MATVSPCKLAELLQGAQAMCWAGGEGAQATWRGRGTDGHGGGKRGTDHREKGAQVTWQRGGGVGGNVPP